MVVGGRRRIDRILDPTFVEGLESVPLDELRARRAECTEEEAGLSYERRLLHARLDIIAAEMRRRAGEDGGSIVERLAQILGDERRTSRGAYPREVTLPSFDHPRRRVEKLVSDDTLASLPDLPDERLTEITEALREIEREISEDRHRVQQVLDMLTQEVARRYKSGEADPSDVLAGES